MSSRGSLSVLLVEDQAGSARLVQELLRNQAALQLTWVETLAAALAWVADHLVDTVLLDLGLPDSQGLDTATRVLRAYPTLPVIVLTGRADDAVALAALNAGAQDYLHKERLDADTLERTIRYAYERKRAEVALREREQQLALAIAGSGVGLWDWRVQTGEMVFSARWAEIGGYTVEELGACSVETWKALTHPEDLVKATALQRQHCADETPIYDCEIRLRHKAGHWVWVLDRGTVTERAADGTPLRMTGTRLDITDRKRLEEERLIRSKLESTGVLAGGIAHDFNNLLMVILGSLEALQDPAANQSALVAAASQATLEARALLSSNSGEGIDVG